MTTVELEQLGKLERVVGGAISDGVRALGDAKKTVYDGNRMSGFLCDLNARALVAAMTEVGEDDWHIVFGVAYGDDPGRPVAHVWARRGDKHFDPTWSIGGSLDGFRYLALAGEEAATVNDLKALENLVHIWKLRQLAL